MQFSFGDVKHGFLFQSVRKKLLQLQNTPKDSKNWRPTVFVSIGSAKNRDTMVSYGVWLESGRGSVYQADILIGEYEEVAPRRPAAIYRF